MVLYVRCTRRICTGDTSGETHTTSESLKRFVVEGVKVDVDIGWIIPRESIDVVLVSFIVPSQRWLIGDIPSTRTTF